MAMRLFQTSSLLGAAAAAVTSTAASICCIGPLAIALLGVNGAILAAAFKPYRGYLLGASFALLAGSFWSVYGRRRVRDGVACPVLRRSWTKVILWTGVTLWVAALLIQYLANRFWLKGGVVL
jgi:MerT mercuric transport protein